MALDIFKQIITNTWFSSKMAKTTWIKQLVTIDKWTKCPIMFWVCKAAIEILYHNIGNISNEGNIFKEYIQHQTKNGK